MGGVEILRTRGSHAFMIKIVGYILSLCRNFLNSNRNIYKVIKCEKHKIGKSWVSLRKNSKYLTNGMVIHKFSAFLDL